jgi:hypothetical protein
MCVQVYSDTSIKRYPPARRRIQEIRILNAVELAERETSMAQTHVLKGIRKRKQPLEGIYVEWTIILKWILKK